MGTELPPAVNHPATTIALLGLVLFEILPTFRANSHGRVLYLKAERFAENIGAKWIQIDSEAEAMGFWSEMGFTETGKVFYAGKTSMVKKIG